MIKITNGVYGVNRLNSKSAPFSLDPKEEARLVALGVAQYVSAPDEGAEAGATDSVVDKMSTVDSVKKRGRKKVKK